MENQKNMDASVKNLETQIGQIVKQLADQQSRAFNPNTLTNPNKHYNIITIRNGEVNMEPGSIIVNSKES